MNDPRTLVAMVRNTTVFMLHETNPFYFRTGPIP